MRNVLSFSLILREKHIMSLFCFNYNTFLTAELFVSLCYSGCYMNLMMICWVHELRGKSRMLWYRGHLVVKHSAVHFEINSHVRAQMNKLHLRERKNPNITVDYDHFGSVFSVIINRDVSAEPIGFRDAIRIQMKRTPVLSLILVYPFYLGTHSSLITMGQRSGGTKPCGWYSCKWKKQTSLFDFSGRKRGACSQAAYA